MTEPAGPGFLVTGARLDATGALYDILVRGDEIRAVTPVAARAGQPPGDAGIPVTDLGGRAVIPGLVDAHVHLDKAYQLAALDRLGVNPGRGLPGAIAATRELRTKISIDDTRTGMRRVLRRMAATLGFDP